jgi:hypothetical protein
MKINQNPDRKSDFVLSSIAELKTLETRFSKMAAKGWLIDKVTLFSYGYKKAEPQELQFIVDILPQITAFDYPENEDAQEYRRMCEVSGWKFAAASKQMQVFYAEKKSAMPIPIHTDQKIEARNLLRACGKHELPFVLLELVLLWFAWGRIFANGYDLFLSNISITQAMAVVVLTPAFLWYIGFLLIWYCRTAWRMEKALPIPKVGYWAAKIRVVYLMFAAVFTIVIMLAGIAMDVFEGAPAVVLVLAALPFLCFGVGLSIRKRIDTQKQSRKANIAMFAVNLIAVALVCAAITALVTGHLFKASAPERLGLPANRDALTLTDFGAEGSPGTYNYYGHGSAAVPLNYTYYEINAEGSVRTDVKKAVNAYLARGLFQNLLEELRGEEWRVMRKMNQEEADIWGATDGYYLNEAGTDFALLYQTTIVQIEYGGKRFNAARIREKIKMMGG